MKPIKCGKAAVVDNVPAELLTHDGQPVIWETGKWPSTWTTSIIITILHKGDLKLCNKYSKVMLKIILNRLKPQAKTSLPKNRQVSVMAEVGPYNRTEIQPYNHVGKTYPTSDKHPPFVHRLQEGLRQITARSTMGNHEKVQHHQEAH